MRISSYNFPTANEMLPLVFSSLHKNWRAPLQR